VIAYVRLDGSEAEIWRISSDGTDQRRIGLGSEPAWSPDGKRLAFTLERGGNVDIYVMAVDGSDILRLTTDPGEDHGATWSPDGSMIAFNSTRSGSDQVWRTNVDAGGWGHNLTQLTQDTNHNRVNNFVAWSPDGRWIAFESDRDRDDPEIYLANAVDGTNQQRLTFTRALDEVPSWSPDGKVILFSSDMHDEPQSGTYDIYVMGVDGSEIRRLTSTTGSASYPSMSAVGKTIAYSYRPDRTSPPELWLMDVDGKNSRLLIRGGDMPKFSPIQVVE
jgi:TolB protein